MRTFTPLLGAEIVLDAGRRRSPLDVDAGFEHGVLVDTDGPSASTAELVPRPGSAIVAPGLHALTLRNDARPAGAGGAARRHAVRARTIVMWWNFVGRTHEEIAAVPRGVGGEVERFGRVEGYGGPRPRGLPAPELPPVRIRPRQNPPPPTAPA